MRNELRPEQAPVQGVREAHRVLVVQDWGGPEQTGTGVTDRGGRDCEHLVTSTSREGE